MYYLYVYVLVYRHARVWEHAQMLVHIEARE